MKKKQFKAESKKLLDMMINSIYTHKEIFLRELISNASDAIDKLYYKQLAENITGLSRSDYAIWIAADKDARTITITDNGIGMTQEELENNLGTIARSGSLDFKQNNESKEDIDIIGQFGVGFYSAFMVSERVTVKTKAYGSDDAFCWESEGADGYTVTPCEKADYGTEITLYIKENTEEEDYDQYLDEYRIKSLIKKYSDYITYPIKMNEKIRKELPKAEDAGEDVEAEVVYEDQEVTVNSMIPLWKKNKKDITKEEYTRYYQDKFVDFNEPARVIHNTAEGVVSYTAMMFIPKKAPFDYYTKEYEKGLALYSNGVLIMEKCPDLLPDYFSFVKGLVDSSDLSLNISREMLQHDRQLKLIAKNIERNIKNELTKMLEDDREGYKEFFKAFGSQLLYGVYSDYGMHKDVLQDLLLFYSSSEKDMVTLKEYVSRMKEGQDKIFYASGETVEKMDMLPQVDMVRDKGYEILYMTENLGEFALMMMAQYDGKTFVNVCADDLDLTSEEEKEALKERNEKSKDMLQKMKDAIGDGVSAVRFTGRLKNHPVCLTTEGALSIEMEKTLNSMPMPSDEKVKAEVVLEINANHPIAAKLEEVAESGDEQKLADYAKLLYAQAQLIAGLSVENPTELSNLICGLM
ncbi:MAG: molecular chaperone HtpG [Firmicutes bacterium]|nr:molecular chaperone HtpG [Bacillota bacterium]MDD7601754.1 molecular chaperone HtpG [Bacillota bacterium]MDY5855462.1 molecular chaperone HtpG [Anaerovoracaceae bacterium]